MRFPSERVEAGAGFDTFFEAEHEPLFKALYFVTGNRHDAEELMQDAFLQGYEDAEALVAAFVEGYEQVRRWPEVDVQTFDALIAARRLHQLNLGLNLRKPGLERFVADHAVLIGGWMRQKPT